MTVLALLGRSGRVSFLPGDRKQSLIATPAMPWTVLAIIHSAEAVSFYKDHDFLTQGQDAANIMSLVLLEACNCSGFKRKATRR